MTTRHHPCTRTIAGVRQFERFGPTAEAATSNLKGAASTGAVVRKVAALLFVAFLAGCLSPPMTEKPPVNDLPWFAFADPVVPQPAPDGYGSEPSILGAGDGSLYVVSVLGSAQARGDGLWKSSDGGQAWEYLNKPDYPFGGGDADLDEDETGQLYLPGQWRPVAPPAQSPLQPYITGGESMATSTDGGRTWTVNPVASNAPVVDRQWTATYPGYAWLAFNQAQRGLMVSRSTDAGRTWFDPEFVEGTWDPGDGVAVQGGPNGIPGDIIVDPKSGALYIPYAPGIGSAGGVHRLFVSRDKGVTFEAKSIHVTPSAELPSLIFGTLAMDSEGTLYYAWAESVEKQSTSVVFLRTSSDGGERWTQPVAVSPAGMTAVFPWIVAGSPGHVAVAFYGATGRFLSDEASAEQEWYPVVAMSRDLAGGNGTFDLASLSPTPNHKGPICTSGTGCSGGRTLGDFFEIGLTREGQVAGVWVDDIGSARLNVVARQSVGSLYVV